MKDNTKNLVKKVIYVADDDRAIVDAIKLVLEGHGFEVGSAHNEAGIRKILSRIPDLLLLDIWMSGSDGRDISRKLKRDKFLREIPIIFISAHPEIAQISKDCGVNGFIAKPFSVDDLLYKISTHIK